MTRDMSRAQFRAAIKRHGWTQQLLWVTGVGKDDGLTTGIGMVLSRKGRRGWKTNYRASLAKACRELQSREA